MAQYLSGIFVWLFVFKYTHADSGQENAVENTHSTGTEYSTEDLGERRVAQKPLNTVPKTAFTSGVQH